MTWQEASYIRCRETAKVARASGLYRMVEIVHVSNQMYTYVVVGYLKGNPLHEGIIIN